MAKAKPKIIGQRPAPRLINTPAPRPNLPPERAAELAGLNELAHCLDEAKAAYEAAVCAFNVKASAYKHKYQIPTYQMIALDTGEGMNPPQQPQR